MNLRVKICGITQLEDGLAAAKAGADALGFMFYPPSKRAVSIQTAAAIGRELPPSIKQVGVFVDASEEEIRRTTDATGISILQFHGSETPGFCQRFAHQTVWKAFRIQGPHSLAPLGGYLGVNAWLLDSYVSGQAGGTGARFNWDLALEAKSLGRPIILAGGLTPDNVGEAVRRVRPFAVDVSSGIESTPGKKDPKRIQSFIAAAREASG